MDRKSNKRSRDEEANKPQTPKPLAGYPIIPSPSGCTYGLFNDVQTGVPYPTPSAEACDYTMHSLWFNPLDEAALWVPPCQWSNMCVHQHPPKDLHTKVVAMKRYLRRWYNGKSKVKTREGQWVANPHDNKGFPPRMPDVDPTTGTVFWLQPGKVPEWLQY